MGFKDASEVQKYIGGIFDSAFRDDEVGPKLVATGLILRFVFTDPDAGLTVDMAQQTVAAGADVGSPSATLSMSSDVANLYWQGKINLPMAMARKKIKVDGNVAALLKLAPLGKSLYPVYRAGLEADGRTDLLA